MPVDNLVSPVSVDFVADAVMNLLEKDVKGIFHLGTQEEGISEYQFAKLVAEVFGFPTELVRGIPLAEFKHIAPYPKNTALSTEKLVQTIQRDIPKVEESLRYCKSLYFSEEGRR